VSIQVFNFEGRALPAFSFRGRECWIAQDVARVLGYESKGWSNSWGRWVAADELLEGQDFATLRGQDLREFKASLGATTDSVVAKTTQLTVLFEPGLNVVCILTEKPLGKRLRRFVAEQVLPDLRRRSDAEQALRTELVELQLRLTAGSAETIWERDVVLEICRVYRKPWSGMGPWPAWLRQPLGAIYRIVLGDEVYYELKRRNPDPRDGSLNYQFLTEARHRLMVRDMGTVSALLRMSTTKEVFFDRLRFAFRRAPLQLGWG